MEIWWHTNTDSNSITTNPTKQQMLDALDSLDNKWNDTVEIAEQDLSMMILGPSEERVRVNFRDSGNEIYKVLTDTKHSHSDRILELGYRSGGGDLTSIRKTVPLDIAKQVAVYFLENVSTPEIEGYIWE